MAPPPDNRRQKDPATTQSAGGEPEATRSGRAGSPSNRPPPVRPDAAVTLPTPAGLHPTHGPSTAPSSASASAPQRFGDYELLEVLGRGGMGVVYRACHIKLNRIVALKRIRAGELADADDIRRFRIEAEAAAALDHPGIVPIYEAGEIAGHPYYTMACVPGQSLLRSVDQGPLEPWEAARIMQLVAGAVQYAHGRGIIHRDLKPGNILLDPARTPRVTDFGLAKRTTSQTQLTIEGERVGTLAYMPPEQELGHLQRVGPTADVYSLGATLYHLLVGRPPFPKHPGSSTSIHIEIREAEPLPPRMARPGGGVPRDLETICLKCLAKEPERRYATAQALADELSRFLAGDPIEARPASLGERAWRRIKKRPVVAGLSAAVLLALLTAAGLAGRGIQLARNVRSATQTLATTGQELEKAKVEKTTEAQRRIDEEYLSDMNEAQELWRRGELGRLRGLLTKYERPTPYDPRGFEWRFLSNQLAAPAPLQFKSAGAPWNRLAFSPDSRRVAALDRDGNLVVWNLPEGAEAYRIAGPAHSFAFTRDRRHCALLRSVEQGRFEIFDAEAGGPVAQFAAGPSTTCFAVHPSGTKLLAANAAGELFLRELPAGKLLREVTAKYKDLALGRRSLDIEHGAVFDLDFSPLGDYFAVGWADGVVQVWSIETSDINRLMNISHQGCVTGVAFSPDGRLLASQSSGKFDIRQEAFVPGDVQLTSFPTGAQLAKVAPHAEKLPEEPVLKTAQGFIPFGQFRPAFSADSRRLFTTGRRTVSSRDVRTADGVVEYSGHDGLVLAVAVSPDGKLVAGAGADGVARVWPAAGNPAYSVRCQPYGGIQALALSPDGRRLAAICDRGVEGSFFFPPTGQHSPARRQTDPALWIWNVASGAKLYGEDAKFGLSSLQFSADSNELWAGGQRFQFAGDAVTVTRALAQPSHGVSELASPDRSYFVRFSSQPTVELWRFASQRPFASLQAHPPRPSVVAVSPNGKWLATGGADKAVCVWSSVDGTLRHTCGGHGGEITALTFSPDSELLISGAEDGNLYCWRVADGQRTASFLGHRREISGIAFAKDGQSFATSSGLLRAAQNQRGGAGEVRLWDLRTGRLRLELTTDSEIYAGVAISPDGRQIFAAANSLATVEPGRIVVWDANPAATKGPAPIVDPSVELGGSPTPQP